MCTAKVNAWQPLRHGQQKYCRQLRQGMAKNNSHLVGTCQQGERMFDTEAYTQNCGYWRVGKRLLTTSATSNMMAAPVSTGSRTKR